MAAQTRIYVIRPKGDAPNAAPDRSRLVRAPNAAQALRHVAQDYHVTVASQDDLVSALGHGCKVEDATTTNDKDDTQ